MSSKVHMEMVIWVIQHQRPRNKSKGALEDRLNNTKVPNEGQEVHEERTSSATPEPTAEAEHDTVQSKIKAFLEDAKKASNEIITNSRVLAWVMTELEDLVPEAHASLKRVSMIVVQTITNALFAETTLPGKSKSTTPILSSNSCDSESFLLAVEAIEKQFLSAKKSKHDFPQFTPPSLASASLKNRINQCPLKCSSMNQSLKKIVLPLLLDL
ncbi:hypothetical protein Cgig2_033773 [Carnegiea gigantea]|uniref:Uncharacterized protein n=1 Tax=Carnegiea gigantea TaxID=171969 RepID=A0A9Q1KEI3_9CARY|nr:hypothetical protein Cgig2_033773 [Carnegiea gigantea]